jgi:hypothetical protein
MAAGCVALALGLVAVVAITVPRGGPRPALQVVGNQLVDADEKPIRLLGVDRSGAEYACVDGWGIFDGPVDDHAIRAMASWHINAVRIPLNEGCWLGINGSPPQYSGTRYRRAIADYVRRLHAAGLYVILDLHWSAPGPGAKATGQQPMADLEHAPAFWASVARTFKNDSAVVFDLYNEPFDIDWRCWRDGCRVGEGWRVAGMQTLVDAVRSTGARQPIIAKGNSWGGDLSSWLEHRPHDPAGQLMAGFHVFDFTMCAMPGCWTNTVAPVAREVPVVTTEFGQRDCSAQFNERFMRWADAVGVSYLGWAWNAAGCGAPSLIRSWGGRPTQSGRLVRDHLDRLRGEPRRLPPESRPALEPSAPR